LLRPRAFGYKKGSKNIFLELELKMHPYRTHTCGELTVHNAGEIVRLSGWVHRKRNHGNLLFIDLRDHYGITQCVVECANSLFQIAEETKLESVIIVTGKVSLRSPETTNEHISTGKIEIQVTGLHVESACQALPLQVNSAAEFPEETRLKYRFLDLRREKMHQNIILRNSIISSLRKRMIEQGFMEFQTPILTASSPEGARDYLVPSRVHAGCFYALPQAPQQFKQLLMISGFDRYFQIAPCFRDEDARADRSPGEFYQLDFEMSFATQDDVFSAIEPVLHGVFTEFAKGRKVSPYPFEQISYDEAILTYGCDKPDLRNPLKIKDVTTVFRHSEFSVFAKAIDKGHVVRTIHVPKVADQPRSFFEKLNAWAQNEGAPGLGYIIFQDNSARGPIAKFLSDDRLKMLRETTKAENGDGLFFVCDKADKAAKFAGLVRTKLGNDLNLISKDVFHFCWVVDFPMYELNEETGKIEFQHNPFSMPQGGLQALETQDPLTIKAHQYDIICNGVELSSGAIRNHLPEVMCKAFAIAGYDQSAIEAKFGGMWNALKFGAPPHGGCAPGIDRIVMLLAEEHNLREVIAFPMTQKAEDLLMQAPSSVSPAQLKELHISVNKPKQ